MKYDLPPVDGKRQTRVVTIRGTHQVAQRELTKLLRERVSHLSYLSGGQYLKLGVLNLRRRDRGRDITRHEFNRERIGNRLVQNAMGVPYGARGEASSEQIGVPLLYICRPELLQRYVTYVRNNLLRG